MKIKMKIKINFSSFYSSKKGSEGYKSIFISFGMRLLKGWRHCLLVLFIAFHRTTFILYIEGSCPFLRDGI